MEHAFACKDVRFLDDLLTYGRGAIVNPVIADTDKRQYRARDPVKYVDGYAQHDRRPFP